MLHGSPVPYKSPEAYSVLSFKASKKINNVSEQNIGKKRWDDYAKDCSCNWGQQWHVAENVCSLSVRSYTEFLLPANT